MEVDSHSHVLFLGENGIVGLQVVLFQQGLAVADLEVEQGVTHAVEEGMSGSGHDVDELVVDTMDMDLSRILCEIDTRIWLDRG